MIKKEMRRGSESKKRLVIKGFMGGIILAAAVLALVGVVLSGRNALDEDQAASAASDVTSASENQISEEEDDSRYYARAAFPYESEDGILEIASLFAFSGPNVDADHQEGEEIAGIQVRNQSEQYIQEAVIVLSMENGTEYCFLIRDLPAGASAVALEQTSQQYDGETGCEQIECSVQTAESSMAEDRVSVETEGSKIIITNISQQQIAGAAVTYRCASDSAYMGGISYTIQVSALAPGESFEYEDTSCILGTPQVVRIEIK